MEMLVYCPFCSQQAVPAMKSFRTVRNKSHRGGPVSHTEEELVVLGDCQTCRKTKEEIKKQFGLD